MCTAAFKVEEPSFEGMMLFIYKEHIVPLQFEQCFCKQEGIQHPPFVLGTCWGTEELGWNERSQKKLRDVRQQSNGFENYKL